MPQTLQEFIKNKGLKVPNITELPSTKVGISDVVKEVPTATKKVLRTVGKQLMKPVGVVAKTSEAIGRTIGEKTTQAFKELPSEAGKILTGEKEYSFTQLWNDYLPEHKTAATTIGLITDIAADPLNYIGGIATKGLELAEKGLQKVPLIQKGLKPVFSTKVGVKAVDALIDQYKSLGEFRKAKVIEANPQCPPSDEFAKDSFSNTGDFKLMKEKIKHDRSDHKNKTRYAQNPSPLKKSEEKNSNQRRCKNP